MQVLSFVLVFSDYQIKGNKHVILCDIVVSIQSHKELLSYLRIQKVFIIR